VENVCRAGQTTYDNTAHAHCVLDTLGYTHSHCVILTVFHGHNGRTNAPQIYVIRTLLVLL